MYFHFDLDIPQMYFHFDFRDIPQMYSHFDLDIPQIKCNFTLISDIPRSILNLLKNKIYILTSFGICCEIGIVSGFVLFLPKYLETQFGTSKSMANLFTGKFF